MLEPERTLKSVLQPLGLTYHPQQLSWAEQVKHNVAGNRMRRQQKSQLVLDECWKINLNFLREASNQFLERCTLDECFGNDILRGEHLCLKRGRKPTQKHAYPKISRKPINRQ